MAFLSNNKYLQSFTNFLKPAVKKPLVPSTPQQSPYVFAQNSPLPLVPAQKTPIVPQQQLGVNNQLTPEQEAASGTAFDKISPAAQALRRGEKPVTQPTQQQVPAESIYKPVEQPKLAPTDFKDYYQNLVSPEKVQKEQEEAEAAKAGEVSAFERVQRGQET